MYFVCLDMEGVLTPEIWIEFAEATGLPELKRTTRDEPDYDKLMKYRMDILKKNNYGLKEIQAVIEEMSPLVGAREFLDTLREFTQVVIISDTFTEFASPLMRKLGWPTIMCNELVVDDQGFITDYKLRVSNTKGTTVKGLKTMGYDIISAGDSFNDIAMIRESEAGFFFRTTDSIKADNPDIPAFTTYDELMKEIKNLILG